LGDHAILITALSSVAVVTCFVFPRIAPLVVAGAAATLSIVYLVSGNARKEGSPSRYLLRPEIPFLAWVFVACLWAASPWDGFVKAAFLAALVLSAIVVADALPSLNVSTIEAIAKGFLIGFLIGAIFICVEIVTRDGTRRLVLEYFPDLERGLAKHGTIRNGIIQKVSGAYITRATTVYCLLWCPAILAATLYARGFTKWLCYAAIAASSIVIVLHPYTQSQTAQFALLVVSVVLVVSLLAPKLALWGGGAGFASLVFFIVPVALAMFAAGLHQKPNVFGSAKARIIIWNYTAERILEKPILGVGTNSTRYLDEARPKEEKLKPDNLYAVAETRAHPHNVYLQIWYELGLVGAITFAALGLSLLRRVSALPRGIMPYAITHFAMCMAILAPTYGLWQNWFQSIVVVSTLILIGLMAPQIPSSRA
jgi:hypothetical protein